MFVICILFVLSCLALSYRLVRKLRFDALPSPPISLIFSFSNIFLPLPLSHPSSSSLPYFRFSSLLLFNLPEIMPRQSLSSFNYSLLISYCAHFHPLSSPDPFCILSFSCHVILFLWQIRDGKYGFSKELGKFCGTAFPPIIYSSDRHLWLRFVSDENIEYDGFQAVFDFIQQPTTGMYATCMRHDTVNQKHVLINILSCSSYVLYTPMCG